MKTLIENLFAGKTGTTFAQIETVTKVTTATKFKNVCITKQTHANVILFATSKDFTAYKNAVIKSANSIEGQEITDFVVSENYFEHTDLFCIVKHKTTDKFYLYAIYNNATSDYFIDGVKATKNDVAAFLTASAAATLIGDKTLTYNKTNNVLHEVTVRTIAIDNVKTVKAYKTALHA